MLRLTPLTTRRMLVRNPIKLAVRAPPRTEKLCWVVRKAGVETRPVVMRTNTATAVRPRARYIRQKQVPRACSILPGESLTTCFISISVD